MRIKHLLNFFVATVFIGVAVGCAEKDLYDPNYGKEPVKGPEEYFGFETRGDVSLDVNYALPGFAALIEVYDIDPMEIVDNTPVKKQGAYPFAIDIPILNFISVTEKKSIDTEYPNFKAWADSKGEKYTDWYNNHVN